MSAEETDDDPDDGMMFRDGDDDGIGGVDLGEAVDKMRQAMSRSVCYVWS